MYKSTKAGAVALSIFALGLSSSVYSQSEIDLTSEDNQMGYAVGVNIGQNLVAQGLTNDLSADAVLAGINDAVNQQVQLGEAELGAAIQAFMAIQQELAQAQQQAAQAAMAENLTASEAFLAENGQRAGVVTTDSGLQYEVIESGPASGQSPTTSNSVLAHYHGTLIDGSVFDSSVDRGEPISFAVTGVIAGWTEALQLMKVGDKWRLFIHPDMAYGQASPSPAIPPNSALIFEVELLEVR